MLLTKRVAGFVMLEKKIALSDTSVNLLINHREVLDDFFLVVERPLPLVFPQSFSFHIGCFGRHEFPIVV